MDMAGEWDSGFGSGEENNIAVLNYAAEIKKEGGWTNRKCS